MKLRALFVMAGLITAGSILSSVSFAAEPAASTPAEMVATYNSLADGVLALRKSESNLVRTILATTYAHAEGTMAKVKAKVESKQEARADIEKLAALVSQIGNEGDTAVAGIRKRLVEGGHHHNSAEEQQGVYDEGFVVVKRAARQALLDAAGKIGRLAAAPDLKALDTEWQAVARQYATIMKEAGR